MNGSLPLVTGTKPILELKCSRSTDSKTGEYNVTLRWNLKGNESTQNWEPDFSVHRRSSTNRHFNVGLPFESQNILPDVIFFFFWH